MKKAEGIKITYNYVLIKTIPEHEHEIYNWLLDNPQIIELKPLFKEYDLLAIVKIDNKDKLGSFILNEIRPLEGVIDTKILQ
jgi:DNA-binding Lrp family transcriptional regulator